MRLFFNDQNLFQKGSPGIDFDSFKKMFFPQFYMVHDDGGDDAEKEASDIKKTLTRFPEKEQKKLIEDRLIKLETKLKAKFRNCYD